MKLYDIRRSRIGVRKSTRRPCVLHYQVLVLQLRTRNSKRPFKSAGAVTYRSWTNACTSGASNLRIRGNTNLTTVSSGGVNMLTMLLAISRNHLTDITWRRHCNLASRTLLPQVQQESLAVWTNDSITPSIIEYSRFLQIYITDAETHDA